MIEFGAKSTMKEASKKIIRMLQTPRTYTRNWWVEGRELRFDPYHFQKYNIHLRVGGVRRVKMFPWMATLTDLGLTNK